MSDQRECRGARFFDAVRAVHARQRGLPPLRALPDTGDRPLSFSENRLWLLGRLDPDAGAYHMPVVLRLDGDLDVTALEVALNSLVQRHDVLRTTFPVVDSEPVARVTPFRPTPLRVEQVADLAGRAAEIVAEPMDLAEGPLFRARLLRAGPDRHALVLCLHHVVSDGWSLGILAGELAESYRGGTPAAPAVRYADFARWEREALTGESLDGLVRHWRERLAGLPPVSAPPSDLARPARRGHRGGRTRFTLTGARAARLDEFVRREDVSPFVFFLAGLFALLHRYSEQDDLAVGTVVANRNRAELEKVVGCFINTLVLRVDLSGDPSFRDLLTRVHASYVDAFAHQDLPFDQLVARLAPNRDPVRDPVVQVMLTYQNANPVPWRLDGLDVGPLRVERETARFDLALSVREADGYRCALEYSKDLFTDDGAGWFADNLDSLIGAALDAPDEPLSRLVLTDDVPSSAAGRPLAVPDRLLHELFAEQATRTPDAPALVADVVLSYREVDERSNRLANLLRENGIKGGVLVAVHQRRSVESVVSVLAVLKAGGAYLPLDPAYPAAHLAWPLENAPVRLVLTTTDDRDGLPRHDLPTIAVDAAGLERRPATPPPPADAPDGLAYVLYTSGSTGRPKGVRGVHSATVNRLAWMWDERPFEAGEVCVHKTALGFVDSQWEMFGGLLRGVPTVVLSDDVVRDGAALVRSLAGHQVSRITLVPSLLHALLDAFPDLGDRLPRLRHWITSGEAVPVELVRRFHRQVPGAALWNLYGSTEVAADCTWFDTADLGDAATVPIGRPIANTSVYVLDPSLRPVPVGMPGRIHVGGAALADGYLDPDDRFRPNPFAPGRLYETGDRGRRRHDGTIEFLGRDGGTVKVRGFRVGPAEVEHAVLTHPDVARAAVVAVDAPGGTRLVCAVVPAPSAAPTPGELLDFLGRLLPAHQVPSAIRVVAELPSTPSGKLDRRALAEAGREAPPVPAGRPETAVQRAIAAIWGELLATDQVGPADDFFALGGHSLLAMRVLGRVRESLGVEIPFQRFFDLRTVRALAEAVEHAPQATNTDPTDHEGTL
ncbi:amino acid adenylation domain-containing protein [Saccharothrix tamanrassetensis]|uniref:Amino acid adenylation domain-containing protein n=1 Tax=Saccharothrix tamanrassetensis TaxID=1051531 RepID=A0A841CD50_9PSEU|nr:non-ribosomal peptide synthetase [Saccharothrix tamanrassetensis]MBB5953676.1 amino acid adenylation domain-containing protein [Saccharothrix tamanrassetensis]